MNPSAFAAVCSAVIDPRPRCSAVAFLRQILRPRTPSGPVKRERLREWSGNFCHHGHATGQPWYLQPVAAHGQGGHPQPALLHQLVTQSWAKLHAPRSSSRIVFLPLHHNINDYMSTLQFCVIRMRISNFSWNFHAPHLVLQSEF